MNERLKLSELNGEVKKVLADHFNAPVWVIGEIAEMNIQSNGHCYLTLVEKGENDDRIIAQARATIWSYTFRMLRPFFETSTGQPFTDGIKVLLQVSVEFHEMYGFSLNVRNIDPTYTLGDLALRRREIIQRLKEEGIFTMNKELELPLVPQKIAVVSSSSAAGYQDFIDQLTNNSQGYKFYIQLFPALMQGNQAEKSILDALDAIYPFEGFFDLVVIIRGGGSQVDLSCFDNYNLACSVSQFPLPVLTGIGHEKDDSIVDMVAHTRLKTPTAVAEFILSGVSAFEDRLSNAENEIIQLAESLIDSEKSKLETISKELNFLIRDQIAEKKSKLISKTWKIQQDTKLYLQTGEHLLSRKIQSIEFKVDKYFFVRNQQIENSTEKIGMAISRLFERKDKMLDNDVQKIRKLAYEKITLATHFLEISRQKGELSDPQNILRRGYSMTLTGGKLLKNLSALKPDMLLETYIESGKIVSKILNINKID
jgi:exodeoxyribonuclease VII large subunit